MGMRVNQLQGFMVCCPLLHLVNVGKQHPQCQFFRFFPQLLSSPALLGLIPSGSSSSLVVSQVLNASQPRPVDVGALKSRVPHKQGALCTRSVTLGLGRDKRGLKDGKGARDP